MNLMYKVHTFILVFLVSVQSLATAPPTGEVCKGTGAEKAKCAKNQCFQGELEDPRLDSCYKFCGSDEECQTALQEEHLGMYQQEMNDKSQELNSSINSAAKIQGDLNWAIMATGLAISVASAVFSDPSGCAWPSDVALNAVGLSQAIVDTKIWIQTILKMRDYSSEFKKMMEVSDRDENQLNESRDNFEFQYSAWKYFIRKEIMEEDHLKEQKLAGIINSSLLGLATALALGELIKEASTGFTHICPPTPPSSKTAVLLGSAGKTGMRKKGKAPTDINVDGPGSGVRSTASVPGAGKKSKGAKGSGKKAKGSETTASKGDAPETPDPPPNKVDTMQTGEHKVVSTDDLLANQKAKQKELADAEAEVQRLNAEIETKKQQITDANKKAAATEEARVKAKQADEDLQELEARRNAQQKEVEQKHKDLAAEDARLKKEGELALSQEEALKKQRAELDAQKNKQAEAGDGGESVEDLENQLAAVKAQKKQSGDGNSTPDGDGPSSQAAGTKKGEAEGTKARATTADSDAKTAQAEANTKKGVKKKEAEDANNNLEARQREKAEAEAEEKKLEEEVAAAERAKEAEDLDLEKAAEERAAQMKKNQDERKRIMSERKKYNESEIEIQIGEFEKMNIIARRRKADLMDMRANLFARGDNFEISSSIDIKKIDDEIAKLDLDIAENVKAMKVLIVQKKALLDIVSQKEFAKAQKKKELEAENAEIENEIQYWEQQALAQRQVVREYRFETRGSPQWQRARNDYFGVDGVGGTGRVGREAEEFNQTTKGFLESSGMDFEVGELNGRIVVRYGKAGNTTTSLRGADGFSRSSKATEAVGDLNGKLRTARADIRSRGAKTDLTPTIGRREVRTGEVSGANRLDSANSRGANTFRDELFEICGRQKVDCDFISADVRAFNMDNRIAGTSKAKVVQATRVEPNPEIIARINNLRAQKAKNVGEVDLLVKNKHPDTRFNPTVENKQLREVSLEEARRVELAQNGFNRSEGLKARLNSLLEEGSARLRARSEIDTEIMLVDNFIRRNNIALQQAKGDLVNVRRLDQEAANIDVRARAQSASDASIPTRPKGANDPVLEARARLEKHRELLKAKSDEVLDAKIKVSFAEEQYILAEADLAKAGKRVETTSADLKKAQADFEKAELDLKQAEIEEKLAAARKVKQEKTDLANAEADYAAARSELELRQSDIETRRKKLADEKENLVALETQHRDLEGQISNLSEQQRAYAKAAGPDPDAPDVDPNAPKAVDGADADGADVADAGVSGKGESIEDLEASRVEAERKFAEAKVRRKAAQADADKDRIVLVDEEGRQITVASDGRRIDLDSEGDGIVGLDELLTGDSYKTARHNYYKAETKFKRKMDNLRSRARKGGDAKSSKRSSVASGDSDPDSMKQLMKEYDEALAEFSSVRKRLKDKFDADPDPDKLELPDGIEDLGDMKKVAAKRAEAKNKAKKKDGDAEADADADPDKAKSKAAEEPEEYEPTPEEFRKDLATVQDDLDEYRGGMITKTEKAQRWTTGYDEPQFVVARGQVLGSDGKPIKGPDGNPIERVQIVMRKRDLDVDADGKRTVLNLARDKNGKLIKGVSKARGRFFKSSPLGRLNSFMGNKFFKLGRKTIRYTNKGLKNLYKKDVGREFEKLYGKASGIVWDMSKSVGNELAESMGVQFRAPPIKKPRKDGKVRKPTKVASKPAGPGKDTITAVSGSVDMSGGGQVGSSASLISSGLAKPMTGSELAAVSNAKLTARGSSRQAVSGNPSVIGPDGKAISENSGAPGSSGSIEGQPTTASASANNLGGRGAATLSTRNPSRAGGSVGGGGGVGAPSAGGGLDGNDQRSGSSGDRGYQLAGKGSSVGGGGGGSGGASSSGGNKAKPLSFNFGDLDDDDPKKKKGGLGLNLGMGKNQKSRKGKTKRSQYRKKTESLFKAISKRYRYWDFKYLQGGKVIKKKTPVKK